jgi:hypothetical protein
MHNSLRCGADTNWLADLNLNIPVNMRETVLG